MQEQKSWNQSRTIVASIVTLAVLIAGAFGIDIDVQTQEGIIELVMVVIGAIGSAVSIYGRIKANKIIYIK